MILSYRQALQGTLKSTQTGNVVAHTITNQFEIPVIVTWLNTTGVRLYPQTCAPGKSLNLNSYVGYYYLITSALTGAFACVVEIVSGVPTYTVGCQSLTAPSDIGPIPQPTAVILIPPDSPRVLVACGTLSNGGFVTREQYWDRQPDSICLAPGETKTYSMTLSSGKQQTSSTQDTVSASLGLSASAGWGPVSASVSSSLSVNSTTFQQVTITEQSTMYVSDTLTNAGQTIQMFLRWQLMDVVTIFNAQMAPNASTITGENPILLQGPYDPSDPRPATALSAPSDPEKHAQLGPKQET